MDGSTRQMTPQELIKYITWYATSIGIRLTTVRLVKFVYLCDLYEARRTGGRTITGFPWAFVYYGPYCRDAWNSLQDAVKNGLIARQVYDSHFGDDKEYSLFSCRDESAEKLETKLHIAVSSQLQGAIKKYGEDTADLLDHVYFETEPMDGVKKGDLLDFSRAKKLDRPATIKLGEIPKQHIDSAREIVARIVERHKQGQAEISRCNEAQQKYVDDNYFRFCEMLDEEELETGLTGIAEIEI